MQTINNIVTYLNSVATDHKQINSFGFGDLWEIESTNALKGVAMWAVLRDANLSGKVINIRFTILIMDLVNKDESNETEVISDTFQVALDVFSLVDFIDNADLFTIEKSSTIEPFTERFDNEWAGLSMDLTFKLNFANAICEVPTV